MRVVLRLKNNTFTLFVDRVLLTGFPGTCYTAAELNSYVSLPSDGVTMSKAPQAWLLTAFENTPACQANSSLPFLLTSSHYSQTSPLLLPRVPKWRCAWHEFTPRRQGWQEIQFYFLFKLIFQFNLWELKIINKLFFFGGWSSRQHFSA